MSLMFAKQFSEAGASSGSGGRKGGRGKGSGMMAKSKRGKREQDDQGDSGSTGLFNMDANGPYRTHMLFPGRKDDEGPPDPRRPSGSPGFMKTMMSWGKRPSEPRSGQEMARYKGPPNRTESESDTAAFDPFSRKTVSFHEGVGARGDPYQGNYPPNQTNHVHPSNHTNSPYNQQYPQNYTNQNGHPYYPYSEPYRENDYSTFGKGNCKININVTSCVRTTRAFITFLCLVVYGNPILKIFFATSLKITQPCIYFY